MSKKLVPRKPAQKPDFLSRSEQGPTRRTSGPGWPGTIAQAGRRLPPQHGGRPSTIFIGRPNLSRPHGLTFPQPRSNLILSLCLTVTAPNPT
jgi:hypothetical protein